LKEKQRYVHQPEAPLKERNWFERHLNWTMFFGLLEASIAITIVNPDVYYGVLNVKGFLIALPIVIPV